MVLDQISRKVTDVTHVPFRGALRSRIPDLQIVPEYVESGLDVLGSRLHMSADSSGRKVHSFACAPHLIGRKSGHVLYSRRTRLA